MEIIENVKSYLIHCDKYDIGHNYITWNRNPGDSIGYTILSKNEYCRYRGETDEYKMLKLLESTNRNDWMTLCKHDLESWQWGYNQSLVDFAIDIIKLLYPLQESLGFRLCIKMIKEETSTIESHIYNVELLETHLMINKRYFESGLPWYLFIIPVLSR